jgi:hypothetical protein
VVLGGFKQPPPHEGSQGPLKSVVVERVVPADPPDGLPHLVQVKSGSEDGCLLESGHNGKVQLAQVRRCEPE